MIVTAVDPSLLVERRVTPTVACSAIVDVTRRFHSLRIGPVVSERNRDVSTVTLVQTAAPAITPTISTEPTLSPRCIYQPLGSPTHARDNAENHADRASKDNKPKFRSSHSFKKPSLDDAADSDTLL